MAGLTPKHHSDATVVRGHITKHGSRLVRILCDLLDGVPADLDRHLIQPPDLVDEVLVAVGIRAAVTAGA